MASFLTTAGTAEGELGLRNARIGWGWGILCIESALYIAGLYGLGLVWFDGRNYLWQYLILWGFVSAGIYGFRGYSGVRSWEKLSWSALQGAFWGAVLAVPALMSFFPRISRFHFISAVVLAMGSALAARALGCTLLAGAAVPRRLVTAGPVPEKELLSEIAKAMNVTWTSADSLSAHGPVTGDLLLVTDPEILLRPDLRDELLEAVPRFSACRLLPDIAEETLGRVPASVSERFRAHYEGALLSAAPDPFQRVFDLAMSLAMTPLLLPLAALTGLAILLLDGRPVLFRQERSGLRGQPFLMLKFRTMANGVPTRLGNWLRKTRLDEIPQILNVLRGEMSLIGPRPETPALTDAYAVDLPLFPRRLTLRPGITGWAQVNAGYAANLEETTRKLEFDLFYVKNRSLFLDLRVLLKTLEHTLGMRGGR
jgi:lipopolysaccharide/colanic/teichoic acid biosynthesis glycosyltransferase